MPKKFRAWLTISKKFMDAELLSSLCLYELPSLVSEGKIILLGFIGIKDKNGKEIFEGDIIYHHYYHETMICEWRQARCAFVLTSIPDGKPLELYQIDSECFEVLGNIYENQELIKKERDRWLLQRTTVSQMKDLE